MTIAQDDQINAVENDEPERVLLETALENGAAAVNGRRGLGPTPAILGASDSAVDEDGPRPSSNRTSSHASSAGDHAYQPKHTKQTGRVTTLVRSSPWAAGGLAFFVASAAVNLSNFLFHVVVSRLLGPSNYGALGSLLNVLVVISVPLSALQAAVTQAEARARGTGSGVRVKTLAFRATLWSLVATALFAGLLPEIESFLHFSSLWSIVILSGWILPSTIGAVLQGILMGRMRFTPVALAMAGGTGFGRLALGVAMVAAGFGVEGAVAASVVGQVLMTLVLLPLLRHELFSNLGDKREERIGRRQSLLSLAALGGYAVFMSMDTVLARHYLAPRQAGWYTAAATAGKIAMFLPGAIALVTFPRFSVGDGRSHEARSALRFALPVISVLGLLAALVMVVFSKIVVSLLFGASYHGADNTLAILGFEAMLLGLVGLLIYFHLARRSMVSLLSWSGVLIGAVTIVLFHRNPEAIALDMVVAAASTLVLSLPAAVRSLLASYPSTTPEEGGKSPLLLLKWRDSDQRCAGESEVYAERVAQVRASQGYDVTLLSRSFAGAQAVRLDTCRAEARLHREVRPVGPEEHWDIEEGVHPGQLGGEILEIRWQDRLSQSPGRVGSEKHDGRIPSLLNVFAYCARIRCPMRTRAPSQPKSPGHSFFYVDFLVAKRLVKGICS